MAKIIRVRSVVNALHPVTDQEGNSPVFAPGPAVLFKDGKTYPACFSYADLVNGNLDLLIDFSATAASNYPGYAGMKELDFNFTMGFDGGASIAGTQHDKSCGGNGSFTVKSRFWAAGSPGILSSFSSQVTLNLGSLATSGKTPWGFKDILRCTFTAMDGIYYPGFSGEDSIELEFYAVGASPARFLAVEGIPADLLRLALLPMSDPTNAHKVIHQGYLTYAGQLVFGGTGFVYNTINGQPNFALGGTGDFSRFDLHSYLRAWKLFYQGPASNRTVEAQHILAVNPQAGTVNCFDQSGILWIIMSLSFQNEQTHKLLSGYFLEPFGWLQGQLVGWPAPNGTNNPFFQRNTTLQWVDPLSPKRRPFSSHVFISFDKKIYDSCAGPHLGTEDLEGYLKARDTVYPQNYKDKNGVLFVPLTFDPTKEYGGKIIETRRGQIGGMDTFFDSGRYTREYQDRQNYVGGVIWNKVQGIGYNGMSTLVQDIKTIFPIINSAPVNVIGPTYGAVDFGNNADESPKVYGSVTYVAWGSSDNGQAAVSFEMNFCDTPATATAYMNATINNSSKLSANHSETLAYNTAASFSNKEPTASTDQTKIFPTLVVRFCIQTMFIELTFNQVTWTQGRDFANSSIVFITAGYAAAPEPGISIGSIMATVGAEGSGSPSPCDETSPVQVGLGEIATLSVPVTRMLDIEWRYNTGNVFLRKWELDQDVLVLEVVPRSAGQDTLTLNFYDMFFQTTTLLISFNVTA